MSKILIVSDTHSHIDYLQEVINKEKPFDAIIHSGDGIGDLFRVEIPEDSQTIFVTGNIDRQQWPDYDQVRLIEVKGHRILIVHGDQYNVKTSLDRLPFVAREHEAHLLVYGHTHSQRIDSNSPALLNPGSLALKKYATVTINSDLKIHLKVLE